MMDTVGQLKTLRESIKLWILLDNLEKQSNTTELNYEEIDKLLQFRKLVFPQHDTPMSFTEQLDCMANHVLHYVNSESQPVCGSTYADLHRTVTRIESLGYFENHPAQPSLNGSSVLEARDAEMLAAVKCEPGAISSSDGVRRMCSENPHQQQQQQTVAMPNRRYKDFSQSLNLRVECYDDDDDDDDVLSESLRLQSADGSDAAAWGWKQASDESSPARGRRRVSPVWTYFEYFSESDESVCTVDTDGTQCLAVLKGKNVTNLKSHLLHFHAAVHDLCMSADRARDKPPTAGAKRRSGENIGRKRDSPVWDHFEYMPDSQVSVCKVDTGDGRACATMLRGKNSTNLKKHLQSFHAHVYDQYWDADGLRLKRLCTDIADNVIPFPGLHQTNARATE